MPKPFETADPFPPCCFLFKAVLERIFDSQSLGVLPASTLGSNNSALITLLVGAEHQGPKIRSSATEMKAAEPPGAPKIRMASPLMGANCKVYVS